MFQLFPKLYRLNEKVHKQSFTYDIKKSGVYLKKLLLSKKFNSQAEKKFLFHSERPGDFPPLIQPAKTSKFLKNIVISAHDFWSA